MSGLLAASRPTDWNLPLFVHVLGAMVLVGGLLTGASALALARGDARIIRLGYFSLLLVALPGFLAMRIGAEWVFTREGWDEVPDDLLPDWIGIGYAVADFGALLFLISLVAGGIGVYRLREGKGSALLKTTMAISVVLLAANVLATWAMAGKPG